MKREAAILKELGEHPHIVQIVESNADSLSKSDSRYIILEYAAHGDLFDYIAKCQSPMGEGLAQHYSRQILSALAHISKKGVCHRDMKPENLLLD